MSIINDTFQSEILIPKWPVQKKITYSHFNEVEILTAIYYENNALIISVGLENMLNANTVSPMKGNVVIACVVLRLFSLTF